jgi:Tfp pilus assembly protein PilO
MRSNERMIFLGVAIVALTVGFYLLVLSPKREKASELKDQVNQLHASISAAEQQASYGEQARKEFPKYYGRMVILGKAVPAQSDTASLLVQLNTLSDQSKLDLRSIALNQGGASATSSSASTTPTSPSTSPTSPTGAASAAATTASTASSAAPTPTTGSSTGATASPVPATEAAAAALPIGSVVGPAGLPTLPYSVALEGGYFDVANFIGEIGGLVKPVTGDAKLSPDGRLLTVNGFSLQLNGTGPTPQLKASLVVTAYSSGQQGLTAGASSSGPAPVSPSPGETQVQPASAVVPK